MSSERHLSHSQNFFKDPELVKKLVEKQTSIRETDIVLDIGAGKGIIAEALIFTGCQVIAIEKDPRLAQELRARFGLESRMQIWQGDFLNYPLEDLPPNYQVFANPPFNFTTDIIRRLTESFSPPQNAYLIVQKEAAERFMGLPREGLASLRIKPWFDLGVHHHFQRQDFEPTPSVDPVLLKMLKRKSPLVTKDNRSKYLDFIAFVFSQWQPNLKRALGSVFTNRQFNRLSQNLKISTQAKPTEVSFEQYLRMFDLLRQGIGNQKAIENANEKTERQQENLQKDYRTRSR